MRFINFLKESIVRPIKTEYINFNMYPDWVKSKSQLENTVKSLFQKYYFDLPYVDYIIVTVEPNNDIGIVPYQINSKNNKFEPQQYTVLNGRSYNFLKDFLKIFKIKRDIKSVLSTAWGLTGTGTPNPEQFFSIKIWNPWKGK